MNHFQPDVTGVLLDLDLGAQEFIILRPHGAWRSGRFETDVNELPAYGIIQPASQEELNQVPEGDRASGVIVIRTTAQIQMAGADRADASDEVRWQGALYKVLAVKPWFDYGFCEAYLTKK